MNLRSHNAMLVLLGLAAAAGAFLHPRPSRAGAWVQPPGQAYVRVSGTLLETDRRLDADGNEVPFDDAGGVRNTTYRERSLSLYAEAGVSPRLTILLSATHKALEAETASARFRTWGAADLMFGLKYGVVTAGKNVVSVGVSILAPTGYDPADYPALGSDVVDATLSVEAGRGTALYWANAEAFLTHRTGGFRSRAGGSLGGGFRLGGPVAARGEVRGSAPVESTRGGIDGRFDPVTVDPSWVDVAGTLSVGVGRGLALEGEVRATAWGENTLGATRWSLALAARPSLRFLP